MKDVREALIRLTSSYSQRSMIIYGQSKRNNTKALRQIQAMAESFPIQSVWIKATQNDDFSRDLLSSIVELTSKFSTINTSQRHQQALLTLERAFVPKADPSFLTDIFLDLGSMAKQSGQSVCFFIEDFHCLKKEEVQALTMAIHRSNQAGIPVMIFGTGLPSVLRLLGNACPYAETLFQYVELHEFIPVQNTSQKMR